MMRQMRCTPSTRRCGTLVASWLVVGAALALAAQPAASAQEPSPRATAFISVIRGAARVLPAQGQPRDARVGASLSTGDRVVAVSGRLSVVFLSGRVMDVGAPDTLTIGTPPKEPAPLLARLATTLDEMSGGSDAGPTVHGMARTFGIVARPGDTYMTSLDFHLAWSPVEDVSRYTVRVVAGRDTIERTVQDTLLQWSQLGLAAGKRYSWRVSAEDVVLPVRSPDQWLELADEARLRDLADALAKLDSLFSGMALPVALQAAAYADLDFREEGERLLTELSSASPAPTEP